MSMMPDRTELIEQFFQDYAPRILHVSTAFQWNAPGEEYKNWAHHLLPDGFECPEEDTYEELTNALAAWEDHLRQRDDEPPLRAALKRRAEMPSLFQEQEPLGVQSLLLLLNYYGPQDVLRYIRAVLASKPFPHLDAEAQRLLLGILDSSVDGATLISLIATVPVGQETAPCVSF